MWGRREVERKGGRMGVQLLEVRGDRGSRCEQRLGCLALRRGCELRDREHERSYLWPSASPCAGFITLDSCHTDFFSF